MVGVLKDEEAAGSEMHRFLRFLTAHPIILLNFLLEINLSLGTLNVCMYVREMGSQIILVLRMHKN